MEELYGGHNGPTSNQMPFLKYKYKQNQPFLGGEAATYQDSHDQVKFKLAMQQEDDRPEPSLEHQKLSL